MKKCDFDAFLKLILIKHERRPKQEKSPKTRRNWTATSTCETEAFIQDFPQKLKVEDVKKTKRPCKTSCKNWKLKM